MGKTSEPIDLDRLLSFQIWHLHSLLNAQARAIISRHGSLTLQQWRIMRVVESDVARTSTGVRKALHLDKSQFSKTLVALSDGGYVTLTPYEEDLRQFAIKLTEKGARALRRLEPELEARNAHLLAALPAEQRETIFATLEALSKAATKTDFDVMEKSLT